jgi:hypothetical protein
VGGAGGGWSIAKATVAARRACDHREPREERPRAVHLVPHWSFGSTLRYENLLARFGPDFLALDVDPLLRCQAMRRTDAETRIHQRHRKGMAPGLLSVLNDHTHVWCENCRAIQPGPSCTRCAAG